MVQHRYFTYLFAMFCLAARRGAWGGGEAPKDFTKPQKTIQSPDRQYKAPTDYTKPRKHPYASNMHPYASVFIRMHPYASIRLIYASERQYSTHAFAEKVKMYNKIVGVDFSIMRSGAQNRSESSPLYKK